MLRKAARDEVYALSGSQAKNRKMPLKGGFQTSPVSPHGRDHREHSSRFEEWAWMHVDSLYARHARRRVQTCALLHTSSAPMRVFDNETAACRTSMLEGGPEHQERHRGSVCKMCKTVQFGAASAVYRHPPSDNVRPTAGSWIVRERDC